MVFGELVDSTPIFGSQRAAYVLIGASLMASGMIMAGTPKQVLPRIRHLLEETRPGIMAVWAQDATGRLVNIQQEVSGLATTVVGAALPHAAHRRRLRGRRRCAGPIPGWCRA